MKKSKINLINCNNWNNCMMNSSMVIGDVVIGYISTKRSKCFKCLHAHTSNDNKTLHLIDLFVYLNRTLRVNSVIDFTVFLLFQS